MQRRTERIWLDNNFNLKQLSRASKNLYNYANYIFKKQLEYNHYTSEYEMMDIMRYHPTYQALPAHSSQQIIKSLVKSWKSYFKAIKEYKRNQNKFLGKPRSPKYKRKNGFHTIFFTSDQVKIRNGFVIFPKKLGLKIQTSLFMSSVSLQQRLNGYYHLEVDLNLILIITKFHCIFLKLGFPVLIHLLYSISHVHVLKFICLKRYESMNFEMSWQGFNCIRHQFVYLPSVIKSV